MKKPSNLILIIFGASGDLTKRKLIPALFDLYNQHLLPDKFSVLGVGRTSYSDENFRNEMQGKLEDIYEGDKSQIQNFLPQLFYQSINTKSLDDYKILKNKIKDIDNNVESNENYIYYLATPPSLYEIIAKNISEVGLNNKNNPLDTKRIIIEKPFGTDLETAKELNKNLLQYFREEQMYRIDHYLGKETVQNLLVTRFANGIFEPLWNRNFIDHIEITSAESIGVENRGGYYDNSGAMRDMVQNHLLQLTALVAMEPPTVIQASAIRNEILKVFQSLRPLTQKDIEKNVIRGQYIESTIKGEKVKGYRQENGVPENSKTETYMALKFFIDNWRWGGVPFYIRTGKRLPTRVTEIVIHFKQTPHKLFSTNSFLPNSDNKLVIRIQPDEGILLKFGMKTPGAGFNVQEVNMDFHYSQLSNAHLPEAYERLLLDCMLGDATLYARGDAVEAAWSFVNPIIDEWKNNRNIPVHGYPAGTWGPNIADDLIEGENYTWRYPCKNLSNDGNYCEL